MVSKVSKHPLFSMYNPTMIVKVVMDGGDLASLLCYCLELDGMLLGNSKLVYLSKHVKREKKYEN